MRKIVEQLQWEQDEERASLMQRTLTGLLPNLHVPVAATINSELGQMAEQQAHAAASELLRRLHCDPEAMPELEQIQAA